MTSSGQSRLLTLAAAFMLAGATLPARAESTPDLTQLYTMLKETQERLAALENENRQAKRDAADARKDATEARTEARALRQKLASISPSGPTGTGVPPLAPAVAGMNNTAMTTKAPPLVVEDRWHFFAGADLLYVQPRWSSNPAYRVETTTTNTLGNVSTQTVDQASFSHDFQATAVLTAGLVAPNGIGLRGRYWWMDSSDGLVVTNPQSNSATSFRGISTAFFNSPGFLGVNANPVNETYTLANGLHLRTADAEATWRTTSGPWTMLIAGGVRYASVRQDYSEVHKATVNGPNPFVLPAEFETAIVSNEFSGFGPTVAAEASHAFGWGGLSAFGSARASWIFGTQQATAVLNTTHTRPSVPDQVATGIATSSADGSLPIVEGEAGLEWASAIAGLETIVRASGYGQVWFNAGNATSATQNANLMLIGFRLSGVLRF